MNVFWALDLQKGGINPEEKKLVSKCLQCACYMQCTVLGTTERHRTLQSSFPVLQVFTIHLEERKHGVMWCLRIAESGLMLPTNTK